MEIAFSAVQRALALPEILSEIFECINQDYGCHCPRSNKNTDDPLTSDNWIDRWGLLAQCGRVNRLWFAEAMPLIWGDINPYGPSSKYLEQRFADLELSRQQCYANFVTHAVMKVSCERGSTDAAKIDEGLKAVSFPKLQHLELHIWHGARGDHVPSINAPNVRFLNLDPHSDALAKQPDGETWDAVLQQVPTLFPLVGSAEVTDAATIWSISVDEILRRLPRLKKLRGHYKIDQSDGICEESWIFLADRDFMFDLGAPCLPSQGDVHIAQDVGLSILNSMKARWSDWWNGAQLAEW